MQGFIPLCLPVYDFFSKIKFVDFFKIFLNQELTFLRQHLSISAAINLPQRGHISCHKKFGLDRYQEPDSRYQHDRKINVAFNWKILSLFAKIKFVYFSEISEVKDYSKITYRNRQVQQQGVFCWRIFLYFREIKLFCKTL